MQARGRMKILETTPRQKIERNEHTQWNSGQCRNSNLARFLNLSKLWTRTTTRLKPSAKTMTHQWNKTMSNRTTDTRQTTCLTSYSPWKQESTPLSEEGRLEQIIKEEDIAHCLRRLSEFLPILPVNVQLEPLLSGCINLIMHNVLAS